MSELDLEVAGEPDVLVAGGSTVGLMTALLLARAGVRVVVVERHPAPLAHPRAMGIGPRTVELLRSAGIADDVDAVCMDMSGGDLEVFSTPTLADADVRALTAAAPPRTDPFRHLTPQVLRGTCPQGRLDDVLIRHARAHGARLVFGTTVYEVTQDETGVTARLGGTAVRARYLVAADGARSGIRTALGIPVSGPGVLGDPLVSVLFRADLTGFTHGLPFITCDITTPAAPGGLLPVDGDREWIYAMRYSPARGRTAEDFTPQLCTELIRTAIGRTDLPVEVVSVLPWQVRAAVADRFRDGRVFLAGDAAHVIPPVGAFGMNTGVADAHNLAWKLALVLAGEAAPALLDTYEAERRPVAETALSQSMLRLQDPSLHWKRGAEGERARAAAGALNAPVLHLGYRYDSTAVLGAVPALPSTEDVEVCLDGAPGSRLPHRWIADGVSTLDLIADRFTLLTGAGGRAWCPAAARLGMPAHTVPGEDWPSSVGIGAGEALLVRPDGFVAARLTAPAELEPALTALTRTERVAV